MSSGADIGRVKKLILIGVGNPLRGDDGAGPKIVQQLRLAVEQGSIQFAENHGDGTELMAAWEGFEIVYIFDAVMNRGKPGRIHRLDAGNQTISSDYFRYSSHAFSVAEAIELAKALGTLPPRVIIYGIEGSTFGHGERITAAVENGINSAIPQILAGLIEDGVRVRKGILGGRNIQ